MSYELPGYDTWKTDCPEPDYEAERLLDDYLEKWSKEDYDEDFLMDVYEDITHDDAIEDQLNEKLQMIIEDYSLTQLYDMIKFLKNFASLNPAIPSLVQRHKEFAERILNG